MPGGGKKDKRLFPRNEAIYKAYVCGATQTDLAKEYKITQPRIFAILAETQDRLTATFHERVEALKSKQSLQLEDVYDKAAKSYAKSLEDAESTKVSSGHDSNSGKEETTTKGQAGDPAFLRVMCQALADIRKIWGMDAPIKTENKHEHGGLVRITERIVAVKVAGKKSGSGRRLSHQGNGSNGNRNGNGSGRS